MLISGKEIKHRTQKGVDAMAPIALGERKKKILAMIVETYVATGEPVGSKTICEMLSRQGYSVSSATIRNEMSDLVEYQLLEQPHTSAGRIPSHLGYRYYIDCLMGKTLLPESERQVIDSLLAGFNSDPVHLFEDISQTLASATRMAAISTTPASESDTIRSIQLVPTGRRTGLVVLMTSDGVMKNRICRCDFDMTPDLLRVIYRLFGEKFTGKRLSEITLAYIQTLAASLGELTFMISPILMAAFDAVRYAANADVCLEGEENLLAQPEFHGSNARSIMEFLNRRNEIAHLLNQKKGGVHIFIGAENDNPELSGSSLLVTKYSINGKEAGAIGIIGPTRMDYSHMIARLNYISNAVGKLLTDAIKNDE